MKRYLPILFIMLAVLAILGWMGTLYTPARGDWQPQMIATLNSLPAATQDRLAPPPTVDPPTQADLGAQVFYQVCMVCHGDRGQGLTDEWRNVLPPPDNNCWQSRCHAANHPPEGFVFPHQVPAVTGPGFLAGFGNAGGLHDFIQSKMPWQAPASLKPAEYWELTAFLMRLNGYTLGTRLLDAESAAQIDFTGKPALKTAPAPWLILLIVLALAVLVLAGLIYLRRKKGSKSG
jgi:hypothetical protein